MTQTCRHCERVLSPFGNCTNCEEPTSETAPVEKMEKLLKASGWKKLGDNDAPLETMKSLLKTLFPVAWKADRGRQDPELMAAYVSVQRILGLTKEEIEEME